MEAEKEGYIEELKRRLRGYKREEIRFYEPHFTDELIMRGGSKEEVIRNLLNPEKLMHAEPGVGKYGDTKYALHFAMPDSQTMIIPVIFDPGGRKSLYILTYILRYRRSYKRK